METSKNRYNSYSYYMLFIILNKFLLFIYLFLGFVYIINFFCGFWWQFEGYTYNQVKNKHIFWDLKFEIKTESQYETLKVWLKYKGQVSKFDTEPFNISQNWKSLNSRLKSLKSESIYNHFYYYLFIYCVSLEHGRLDHGLYFTLNLNVMFSSYYFVFIHFVYF